MCYASFSIVAIYFQVELVVFDIEYEEMFPNG